MTDAEQPQIYLVTPPVIDLERFPDRLALVLDAHPVACLRVAPASGDERTVAAAADACRAVAHARDVAVVIERHLGLVERLGLDGVHLADGARGVRAARTALGPEAIVGAFCGTSRHDGLSAGEAGADYVAFGPAGHTALGSGARVDRETFEWWSEMIEIPVVAEGALDAEAVASLAPVADFLAFGEEIWREEDAADALARLVAAMG
jgi:thiamine-phosphate pyrophosphorylase